jgi:hypothetical protein
MVAGGVCTRRVDCQYHVGDVLRLGIARGVENVSDVCGQDRTHEASGKKFDDQRERPVSTAAMSWQRICR